MKFHHLTLLAAMISLGCAVQDPNGDTPADAGPTVELCGNGVLDADEECDDSNTVDSDACLNNCTEASCGDGFVQLGEEPCDDGNACTDASQCQGGACVATESTICADNNPCLDGTCTLSTCEDGLHAGAETDQDCGGPACAPCTPGARCAQGPDCASGVCEGEVGAAATAVAEADANAKDALQLCDELRQDVAAMTAITPAAPRHERALCGPPGGADPAR